MKREKNHLSPRLYQAARLIAFGFKNRQVCQKLNISESHLSKVSHTPLFKATVKQLMDELNTAPKAAQEILMEASPQAAETIVEIMNTKDNPAISPRLRKEAAMDVLKGAGVVKSESTTPEININISEQKVNLILETIEQIRRREKALEAESER